MADMIPGNYCILDTPEGMWPCVILEENMVPEEEKKKRPQGPYYPIFMLGKDKYQWKNPREITRVETMDPIEAGVRAQNEGNEPLHSAWEYVYKTLNDWRQYIADLEFEKRVQEEEDRNHTEQIKRVRVSSPTSDGTNTAEPPPKKHRLSYSTSQISSTNPKTDVDDITTDKRQSRFCLSPLNLIRHGPSFRKQEEAESSKTPTLKLRPSIRIHKPSKSQNRLLLQANNRVDSADAREGEESEDLAPVLNRRLTIHNHTTSAPHSLPINQSDYEISEIIEGEKSKTPISPTLKHRPSLPTTNHTNTPVNLSKPQSNDGSISTQFSGNEASEPPLPEHPGLDLYSGARWSTEEDGEVLRLRERVVGHANWNEIIALFKQIFPGTPRTACAIKDRYRKCLAADATKYLKSALNCAELRNRALAHLLTSDRDAPTRLNLNDRNAKWTAEEDGEVLRLRERVCKNASWGKIAALFEQIFPNTTRSDSAIKCRYENNLASDANSRLKGGMNCEEMRERALSYLRNTTRDDPVLGMHDAKLIYDGSSKWSVEEDSELLRLRERVLREPKWGALLVLFKKKFPNTPRSCNALAARYGTFLAPEAKDCAKSAPDCDRTRAKALAFLSNPTVPETHDSLGGSSYGINWTIREDAELLRLHENVVGKSDWDSIFSLFTEKFPDTCRTRQSLENRYRRNLASNAKDFLDAGPKCERTRAQALVFLARQSSGNNETSSLPSPDEVPVPLNEDNYIVISSDTKIENDLGDDSSDFDDSNSSSNGDSDSDHEDETEGDTVNILIGDLNESFKIPITRIEGNVYFIDDVIPHPDHGALITGSRWSQITPVQFRPVYEFLKYGDYEPQLCDIRLKNVETKEQHIQEAMRCGEIFNLARQMLLWDLLGLVARKYAMLQKDPLQTLVVARKVYSQAFNETEGEKEMRDLLVREVVEGYWVFVETQGRNLRSTMKKLPKFHLEVLKGLQEKVESKIGAKVKGHI